MAGLRKRKHATLDEPQSEQTLQSKTQLGIQAFGRISKANVGDAGLKKRKTAHKRDTTSPSAVQTPGDKKRKRALDTVDEEPSNAEVKLRDLEENATNDSRLRQIAAPQSKRLKGAQPPTTSGTPTKDTAALFDKLKLNTAKTPIYFSLDSRQQAYDTPPDTPPALIYDSEQLPAELEDLLMLQAAFLSALSLYYAHNGISSPVNVKTLLPMITKSWRKRAVSFDDLRILLGVAQDEAQFTLQDFGRAGICLSKSQPRGRAIRRAASSVDEVDLNARFEEALQSAWRQWLATTPKENHDVTLFIDQMPLADITKHESVQQTAPLFARGEQRLADLKASQAAANPIAGPAVQIIAEQRTSALLQSRSTSLLDRVLAKQAHAASLPAGPTREQLERKSALHRIEDIERILDLLAAGRPRCSFSMPVMVQKLQQSLRNPISREEVERCLGLMANEITPGFVKLLRTGSVAAVVLTKGEKIGLEQLRERVQKAEN